MPYTFRPAVESDVQAIADIYNASVMAGGATADLTPRTFDQRRAWVESHTPPYGVFVVESEEVVPEFLRTLVFARPRGDDQFADCTFSPSLDMSR